MLNESPHHVRKNLFDALLALRNSTSARTMWVDVICIDQANTKEQNEQVVLMGQIYSSASRVIVWLGVADEETGRLLELVNTIGGMLLLDKDHDVRSAKNSVARLSSSLDLPAALARLGARFWWSRRWRIQEVLIAVRLTFQVGGLTSDWPEFSTGVEVLIRTSVGEGGIEPRFKEGLDRILSMLKLRSKTPAARNFI
jgi:hypothetical protein